MARDVLCLDWPLLIDNLQCNDSIEVSGKVKLRWKIDGADVNGEDVEGVLNFLEPRPDPDYIATRFDEPDRAYAGDEYSSYLYFALAMFRNVLNSPRDANLCGLCASLPLQWATVRAWGEMAVPHAFWGPTSQVPITLRLDPNTIASANPYDYGHWESGIPDWIDSWPWALFYKRPSGYPIVCTALDDFVVVRTFSTLSEAATTPELSFASSAMRAMMKAFKLRLAQMLLFRAEDTWTFGAITPRFSLDSIPLAAHDEFLARLGNLLARAT